MAREEDRERAIRGRLAIESRLAEKFSAVLETGSDVQKKQLLAALTEFPLRRGDVYDLDADLSKPAPLVYSRIGNDIEQIVFFGSSAERFARALAPLLESTDPETRKLAQQAALLVREAPFPAVNKLAGERGAAIETISRAHRQFARRRRGGASLPSAGAERSGACRGRSATPRVEAGSRLLRRQRRARFSTPRAKTATPAPTATRPIRCSTPPGRPSAMW